MRLWTIHPKYLDARGIVALWREGLLAQAVLTGHTKGYTAHPQLLRFKACHDPLGAIGGFLFNVQCEAVSRGYNFDVGKILRVNNSIRLTTTTGQVKYEFTHLLKKLLVRDPIKYQILIKCNDININPIFIVQAGNLEDWEKTDENT